MAYALKDDLNELHSKIDFATLSSKPINGKPSVGAEGFLGKKTSDSAQTSSENGSLTTSILSDAPNLYKQRGDIMSKIPYSFETPVPKYFRENGWFKNENTFKFVTWAFSKCSNQTHIVVMNNKEIILEPYEFVAGRLTSPGECFLTENIFRNQLISMQKAGLLKKSTNSLTNHYTCYIWVTERFYKNNNQQNNQPTTNRQPTDHHNQSDKKIIFKEDHPSIPSFEKNGSDELIDSSFSKKTKKQGMHIFTGKYPNGESFEVWLTEKELEKHLKIHSSKENLILHIQKIADNPGRKHKISDWSKAIGNWKFSNETKDRSQHNEQIAKALETKYEGGQGWLVSTFWNRKKDCRGILFQNPTGYGEPIEVLYTDIDFEKKVEKTIKEKNIKQKG